MTASKFKLEIGGGFWGLEARVLGALHSRRAAAKSLIHFSVELLASIISIMQFPLAAGMKLHDARCFCLVFPLL